MTDFFRKELPKKPPATNASATDNDAASITPGLPRTSPRKRAQTPSSRGDVKRLFAGGAVGGKDSRPSSARKTAPVDSSHRGDPNKDGRAVPKNVGEPSPKQTTEGPAAMPPPRRSPRKQKGVGPIVVDDDCTDAALLEMLVADEEAWSSPVAASGSGAASSEDDDDFLDQLMATVRESPQKPGASGARRAISLKRPAYLRALVLDAVSESYCDGGHEHRQLALRVFDERHRRESYCLLRGDWARTQAEPGDYVHISVDRPATEEKRSVSAHGELKPRTATSIL